MPATEMDVHLDNKIALVTGAGRGIGKAICLALARCGARVIASARTAAQIDAVAEGARGLPGGVVAMPVDIADADSVSGLFAAVGERFGRLDVLVNNAGIGMYGPASEFPVEDFDRVMQVNTRGTFLCCQQAMRVMVPQKSGFIINMSSVVGIKGYGNQIAYAASKHAVMGMTKTLAVEAQPHNIRVSAILPGGVDTDMAARARPDLDRSILIRPEDVANTVLFLLSLSDSAHVDQVYVRRRTGQPF